MVHAHLYRSQVYGRPAAWLAGTPVVLSTEHSIGETHLERRKMTPGRARPVPGHRDALGHDGRGVRPVRERLVNWGVRPQRVTVIPNGVDLQRVAFDATAGSGSAPSSASRGDYVIGVLGRLDPNKQFDLVIEAAAPLLADGQAADRGQG